MSETEVEVVPYAKHFAADPNLSIGDSMKLIQFGLAHKDEILSMVAQGQAVSSAYSKGDWAGAWSLEKQIGDTVLALQTAWTAFNLPAMAHAAAYAASHAEFKAKFDAAFDPHKLGDGKILGVIQGIVKNLGGLSGIWNIVAGLVGVFGGVKLPTLPPPVGASGA